MIEVSVLGDKDSVSVGLIVQVYREVDDEPAAYAKVIIKSDVNLVIGGAYVNEDGHYLIKLRYSLSLIRRYTLVISYEGQDVIANLSKAHEGVVFQDYGSPPSNGYALIAFSIQVPPTKKLKRKRYDRKLKHKTRKMRNNVVNSFYDFHLWLLDGEQHVFSIHLVISKENTIDDLIKLKKDKVNIEGV